MPQRAPGVNDFDTHLYMLQENLKDGPKVTQITSTIFKTDIGDQITYWVGTADATMVSIIADTTIIRNMCKIELISKNPDIPQGSPPYASDLCFVIKNDVRLNHLVLSGEDIFSDDAVRLWHGIVKRGNAVSVYDTTSQQYVLLYVNDQNELDQFVGGPDKKRYVFVLSESKLLSREIFTTFGIMEIKRKANWPLFEHLTNIKGNKNE
jgi:hypothetical protein